MADKVPKHFGSTSDLVPIYALLPEEEDGGGAILIMNDGSFRMLIRSSSINFDLKDPIERRALTLAFGALVDSLNVEFPLQIVSHSKSLNIDQYVEQFEPRLANANTPEALKPLIRAHQQHFVDSVKQEKLLQREIYLVIPWKGIAGPLARKTADEIPGAQLVKVLSRNMEKRLAEKRPTDMEVSTARQQLERRSDSMLARLQQIGVEGRRLGEEELRHLLYSLFHPSLSERQRHPGIESEDSMITGFSAPGRVPRSAGPQAAPPPGLTGPVPPSIG